MKTSRADSDAIEALRSIATPYRRARLYGRFKMNCMRKGSRMIIAAQLADHAAEVEKLMSAGLYGVGEHGLTREEASKIAYTEICQRHYSFTKGRVVWKKRAECDGKQITIVGGYAKGAFEG
jgi:hypothetical protein